MLFFLRFHHYKSFNVYFFQLMFHHHHHHHHHVALSAWIFLTLARHPSLSSIAFSRSSELHPVSAQSCCIYIRAGRPAFARPCEGVHRSTSLMSSSLLLQQCPTCLVRLILIVFMIGGWWRYSYCFVGYCHQDLFNRHYFSHTSPYSFLYRHFYLDSVVKLYEG